LAKWNSGPLKYKVVSSSLKHTRQCGNCMHKWEVATQLSFTPIYPFTSRFISHLNSYRKISLMHLSMHHGIIRWVFSLQFASKIRQAYSTSPSPQHCHLRFLNLSKSLNLLLTNFLFMNSQCAPYFGHFVISQLQHQKD